MYLESLKSRFCQKGYATFQVTNGKTEFIAFCDFKEIVNRCESDGIIKRHKDTDNGEYYTDKDDKKVVVSYYSKNSNICGIIKFDNKNCFYTKQLDCLDNTGGNEEWFRIATSILTRFVIIR